MRLVRAEVLKLRKRRGLMVAAFAIPAGALALAALYLASRGRTIGGTDGFRQGMFILVQMTAVSAVLVGASAGAGDLAAGVFRDLVVTGRSRWQLFAARVPAALAITIATTAVGWALGIVLCFAFDNGHPDPSTSTILQSGGWLLLSASSVSLLTVGIASLTGQRSIAVGLMLGWQLAASQLLISATSLGTARRAILPAAVDHFKPHGIGDSLTVAGPLAVAVVVIVAYLAVGLGAGAWRTAAQDA
jgi:ABC-type transport system involved in multi-copper enzyme maturation permease subunit